jgi:hypothetical protein
LWFFLQILTVTLLYAARDPMTMKLRAKDKILRNLWGLLLLSLGLVFPSQAETFRNPRRIPIPSNPLQVGTADFNGDGRPDFYYADASGLNVILANSDGSYAASQTTAIGAAAPEVGALGLSASSCRAADFNGDGFADAVCFTSLYSSTESVTTFMGNGDGTLRPGSTVSINVSPIPEADTLLWIAFADINSDGHLDILFQDTASETLYSWFGDGTGQFGSLVSSRPPFYDESFLKGATVADINGDGHPDIVFTDDPLVMYGVGDGTFTAARSNLIAGTSCHLADFDKDGHLDLFCANGYLLEIHHGNPDGTFNKSPVFSKGYSNADFIQPFAARDLNGDGYLDILALSADGLVIFFGRPGLQFSAPVHYAFYNAESFDEDQGDPSLIADYDLDGNVDLAMPGVNGIYITYGKSNGTFDALPVIRSGLTTGYSVVADFNEDGTPDIFTSGTDSLQLLLSHGNGTFGSPVMVQASGLSPQYYLGSFETLYVGDFDGDKHKDVIALGSANPDLGPQLFLGRGDGSFEDPLPVASLISNPYAVADINRDGRDDLIFVALDPASATGTLNVLLSNGDGTLDPITTTLPGNGYSYGLPAAADFNRDGKVDLIVPEQQTVQVLLGRGDGSFDAGTQAPAVPQLEGQPCIFGQGGVTGDFDHDGNADFAVHCMHAFSGAPIGPTAVFVFYGHGDGTFSAPVTAAILDRNYTKLIAVDLNGDGLSDFVLSTTAGNDGSVDYRGTAISIVHSLPGRKFSAEMNLIAGQGFVSMAAADFNRDGQPDLLFTNGNLADSLVLLTNVGTPSLTLTSNANPSGIGQTVTFTATISAPANLTKLPGPGTITFDGLPSGNASVSITFAAGGPGRPFQATATYEAAALPVGSTFITATFPGDSLLNAASASLTQVVNPPPIFQLVASPTTLALKAGATANNSVSVTVKALYGFTGNVTLSCKVAYLGSGSDDSPPTCGFGTNSLSVKDVDVSTPLIVSTTAAMAAARKVAGGHGLHKTGIVLWGGVLLLLLPGRRYRWLTAAMMIFVVSGALLSLSSCGGSGGGSPPPNGPTGTQTGNYSITVSATSNTAVPAPVPVTVQLTID